MHPPRFRPDGATNDVRNRDAAIAQTANESRVFVADPHIEQPHLPRTVNTVCLYVNPPGTDPIQVASRGKRLDRRFITVA